MRVCSLSRKHSIILSSTECYANMRKSILPRRMSIFTQCKNFFQNTVAPREANLINVERLLKFRRSSSSYFVSDLLVNPK